MPVNRRPRHRAAEPGTAWATVRQHPRGWRRGTDVSLLAEGTGQLQAEGAPLHVCLPRVASCILIAESHLHPDTSCKGVWKTPVFSLPSMAFQEGIR